MKTKSVGAYVVLLGCCAMAVAQAAKPAAPPTVGGVLDAAIGNVEREFVPAAEAMPEDRYSFVPANGEFKGVRTFAMQVKHVAAVNYLVGAAMLGEKVPVDAGGENGPDAMKSKADIVKFLKDSFTYLHKAAAGINDKNVVAPIKGPFGEGAATRLGMATLIVGHCFDHYGQVVVYLRMNGIVPPASRR
jgi:hypothetical protein